MRYVSRGGPHLLLLEMDAVLVRGFAARLRALYDASPPLPFDVCIFGPVAMFHTPFGEGKMNEVMDQHPASVVLESSGDTWRIPVALDMCRRVTLFFMFYGTAYSTRFYSTGVPGYGWLRRNSSFFGTHAVITRSS